jgi:hypothetical protein
MLHEVQRHPLRRLWSDARQAAQGARQFIKAR